MLDRPHAMIRNFPADAPERASSVARASRDGMTGSSSGGDGGRPRHPIERPVAPPRRHDDMGTGLMISAVLHTALAVLVILGLPHLFTPPPVQETSISVSVVNMASVATTTARNEHPVRDAKPITPPPIPPEKLQPPVPDPLTPPPAPPPRALPAPPPPPPPEVKPQPPQPQSPPIPETKPELKPDPKPTPLPPPPPPLPQHKPTPPTQVAKTEPRKPDDQLDKDFKDLLNKTQNLARDDSREPPKHQRATPAQTASSLPDARLSSQISSSDEDAIRAVVDPCFFPNKAAAGADTLHARIQYQLAPDGSVLGATVLDAEGGANHDVQQAFADAALRAALNSECSKLPIPSGKYDQLKDLIINFSIKDAL